ncbi:MAG: prepilin-type N-terminal cleavage/methylation domain-containing protein [Betaproteobacteria bacterium]
MKSKQSGFTLVEIAIVLVIVGLLLGGVLKGQELITSSKAKALYADKSAIQAAYNTYNDRFRAVPGDDNAASGRFTGLACGVQGAGASAVNSGVGQSCNNGDGNGALTNVNPGNWNNTNAFNNVATRLTAAAGANIIPTAAGAANEAFKFWQHLRAAQLIKTEGTAPGEIFIQPNNAVSGFTHINSGNPFIGQQPSTLYITQFNTPGNVAQAMDAGNDDGFINRGGIRAQSNGTVAAPNSDAAGNPYLPGTNYSVSTNLL